MKTRYVLIGILLGILAVHLAYTGVFDFLFPQRTANVNSETVTCDFAHSSTFNTCYVKNTNFKCSGRENCNVQVSGAPNTTLTWQGTCSGRPTSVIDGKSERVSFDCRIASCPEGCTCEGNEIISCSETQALSADDCMGKEVCEAQTLQATNVETQTLNSNQIYSEGLKGNGRAYVCVTSDGELYRSVDPCNG